MALYHVEIGYKTKRSACAVGMTVKAFGPDEAEGFAREKIVGKYPARKWCFSDVREATEGDIACGVFEATAI